jgi:hypothetical protein
MYIPRWLLLAILLIGFFTVLLVTDRCEREKRNLQEPIEELGARLEHKEESEPGKTFTEHQP